jgi:hypothetical protein
MTRHRLTDRQIQNARPKAKPYRLADGDGLYLYVPLSGASSWQFRYRLGDKPQTATLGRLDRITLGQARAKAQEVRTLVADGHHVTAVRRVERAKRGAAHTEFLRGHLADDANVAVLLNEALAGGDEGDVMYGIPDRRYVTSVGKARQLTSGDLAQITDPYTRMSLRLQATFGLRRACSLKIRPGWADRGDTLALEDSWAKGGSRPRDPDPQCRATPRPG